MYYNKNISQQQPGEPKMKLKQRFQVIKNMTEKFLLEKQVPFAYCGPQNISTWRQKTNHFEPEFIENLKYQTAAHLRLCSNDLDLTSLKKLASYISDYLSEYLMRAPGYTKESANNEISSYLNNVAERVIVAKKPKPVPVKKPQPIEAYVLAPDGSTIHRIFETKNEYNKFLRKLYQK